MGKNLAFLFLQLIRATHVFLSVTVCFCFVMLYSVSSVLSQTESNSDTIFRMVVWPAADSVIFGATNPADITTLLVDTWYKGHLPTYTGKTIQILYPETDSLKNYIQQIERDRPECLEGDYWFVEREINKQARLYMPLLTEKTSPLLRGILVFRSKQNLWQGVLGIVHPSMSLGGKQQIENWEKQTGHLPNWVAFYSVSETLRHLLAGSVQSVAIPDNALESFLRKENRLDLLQRLEKVPLNEIQPSIRIYLRKDLYDQLLFRTLIAETWLRNYFPQVFLHTMLAEPVPESSKSHTIK